MQELFPKEPKGSSSHLAPLADRVRPANIDEVIGQEHLIGEDGPLRKFFELKEFPSILFWGPPGVGKTTLAYLIAEQSGYNFVRMSAVDSGVADVRKVINYAKTQSSTGNRTLLFIDEIHRFNKSQQDALLHAVEKGIITLIGATTENPSFEVIAALLSRCQVYRLHFLTNEQILKVVEKALSEDEILKKYEIEIEDWEFLQSISAGDARTALNAVELAFRITRKDEGKKIILTRELFEKALQQKTAQYDKKGESHYDTISAFIKSLRGSDPDAALFWLVKMLEAGEDPRFIARRMVIFASEDIGNAEPFAVTLAVSIFNAVELIGLPEAQINLAQGVTYLASCPKSNASYVGLMNAFMEIRQPIPQSVPMHLRNAPTQLMKDEGYHAGYQYPHDYEDGFVRENYFPDGYTPKAFYFPKDSGREANIKERLNALWKNRYTQDE
ncbi:MAG: replication-associated recombination protein A [Bacteroidetes bacterium]|nr:MAG: replication-associated recombination protein A [Bacteroidota bacterium]